VAVSVGLTFQSVSAGFTHSCGVTTPGDAYCWGWNLRGQLGDGTNTDSNVPVEVSGGLTFQSVSAGGAHSCGVTPAGDAYCWGRNFAGQLGNGASGNGTNSNVPVGVDPPF
jgi:alpha-tubulin suppressor-like RCC1 family protein